MGSKLSFICLCGDVLEDRIVPQATAANEYVTQFYTDLLHRNVDAGGLSYWSEQIVSFNSLAGVVLGIEDSPEFRYNEIVTWYTTYLNRRPDIPGLVYWGSQLETGSFEPVQAGILGSQEYFNDAGGTNQGFLESLYQDVLNRDVDPQGDATYTAALNSGVSRTAVAYSLLTSTEYRVDLIESYYESYLHRSADPTGMDNWLNQLAQGATDQEVIAGFLSSTEYTKRLPNAPIITIPNKALDIEATTFTIVGTADDGSLVQIMNSSGSVVGSEQLVGSESNFSITVPLTANAANNFTATATNEFGNVSPKAIVPTITEKPGIITVKAPASQENKDGDVVSDVQVTATDTDSNSLTYSASNLPTGLSINSKTGVISGTITATASNTSPYNVTVSASDGVNSSSATFAWVVLTTATSSTPLPFSLTDPAWVFQSSGVRTWDVTVGTGATAAIGSKITVTYTGYLANGTVFNATTTGFTATLGTGLIQGWNDGIPGMKVGGERRLDIPASLGYGGSAQGTEGQPGYIPPNSELVFDVILTAIG